jgi:hypothetical protein
MNIPNFREQLEDIINCNSMESGSDTPDFILADYLIGCLAAYDRALEARERWYGRTVMGDNAGEPAELHVTSNN